jgi:hypothetical protein
MRLANNNSILIMDDVNCENLKELWEKTIDQYNLTDVSFDILDCKFHSIKKLLH